MSKEFFDAIKQGDMEEVERRLSLDPILIHARENGLSPILVAAYHHEPQIASFLADKTVAITIFEAAATGKINNVIRLLARDPDLVNAFADDGFQPLGLACFFGHSDVAEYLVKAGANVNSKSQSRLKVAPIQSAAAGGHVKIVKLLLDYGADPNIREQGGFAPLHAAAQNGDEEMIRMLLFRGADLNIASDNGKTALDLAMESGHEKAALLLGEGITKRFPSKKQK
jgi:ankyrin repeat protein